MTLLQSLKPFWPLLFTFVLPRAINYYRVLKTAIRTRPPPRPLPIKTSHGINALFGSICIFLISSLPRPSGRTSQNVFVATNSRLHIPTDVLFSRLVMLRPDGVLTSEDEALRAKLTSPTLRKLYLRFGPSTLINCSFCQPDDNLSYLLYHLPTNVIFPHLLHLFALGLATSETVAGLEAGRWRNWAVVGGLALAVVDVYITSGHAPALDATLSPTTGLFWTAAVVRPLTICLFDAVVAFCIYARTTGRFLLFPSLPDADPATRRRQSEQLLNQANVALQMAHTKLRAFTVTRNAVVRDPRLKETDDDYWRTVVALESPEGDGSLWEDEDVQAAMARAYGNGSIDVTRMRREADAFVLNVTKGLEASTGN